MCVLLSTDETLSPGKPKGAWLDFSLASTLWQALPAIVSHQCKPTSSVRVPTNPNQPTLQTPVYKSLASLLYKSNPFRSPGRKSTPRPQAVLLNLHKLLGTRFPTPTHHIDRWSTTWVYWGFSVSRNLRLGYQLSHIWGIQAILDLCNRTTFNSGIWILAILEFLILTILEFGQIWLQAINPGWQFPCFLIPCLHPGPDSRSFEP